MPLRLGTASGSFGGMSRRRLEQLRFAIDQCGRKTHVLVSANGATYSTLRPPAGRKYCDLKAGDHLLLSGSPVPILEVQIATADPPSERGRIVTSGRAWLAGE